MSDGLGGPPPDDDRRARTLSRPLTPGQRGLWFLHLLDPQDVAYNTCTAIELRGRRGLPAIRAAVAGIGRRHDSLRAVVRDGDVGPPCPGGDAHLPGEGEEGEGCASAVGGGDD